MILTKRNHYNPCFWTAHWNPAYFELARKGEQRRAEVRSQQVFVLNVKANKIYSDNVDNVHYDKGIGLAEITPEDAKGFCRRHFPDAYEEFCKEYEAHPETVCLDFENVLTGLEETPAYTTLLEVIRKGCMRSLRQKGELTSFLAVHELRSHAAMNSMVEMTEAAGLPKFEYLWMLKRFLSRRDKLYPYAVAIGSGRWRFYRAYRDTFPLADTPILLQPASLMIALSPRLLLEIDRTDQSCENGWVGVNHIPQAKLEEFRRRTLGNTFREIIFGDRKLLEEWQRTPEFAARHALMADTRTYNAKVAEYLDGSVWRVNVHGNTIA